ncbi:MAG: hypothetical protein RL719_284, partial [Actinomycetota bacterium]
LIAQEAQATLTISSDKTSAVKGQTANLSATGGTTTGAISYSVVTGASVCSISGSVVTFIGSGTCSVKATRVGDINYADVDSAPLTLTAVKATQSQLVVAQSVGMLPNVAIGGKSSTSYNVSGGNGTGALSVAAVTGCSATMTGSTLNVAAGTQSGLCTIDVAKAENDDYSATTYRVTVSVFRLPGAAQIGTPVMNLTNTQDGVGVDVPFSPAVGGALIAPITGYQLQTKTGSNWVNADNGLVLDPAATKISINVTPWTSLFTRVAPVTDYDLANGSSRTWSTYGGATAQAFQVTGIITSLSASEISATVADTIVVTGMGFDQNATPTVDLTATQPIFQVNGASTATIRVPATVASVNRLSFRYPGTLLPKGVKSLPATITVNNVNSMRTNAYRVNLTSDLDSIDLGLDLNEGRFAPKISTVFAGKFTWSFKTSNNAKIFLVSTCVQFKTVKGVKSCVKTAMQDSASCSISQDLPVNKAAVRRTVTFKTFCQLNTAGKLILIGSDIIDISATATFAKAYPKTGLPYVLVGTKKTKVLPASVKAYTFKFGDKQVVRG